MLTRSSAGGLGGRLASPGDWRVERSKDCRSGRRVGPGDNGAAGVGVVPGLREGL